MILKRLLCLVALLCAAPLFADAPGVYAITGGTTDWSSPSARMFRSRLMRQRSTWKAVMSARDWSTRRHRLDFLRRRRRRIPRYAWSQTLSFPDSLMGVVAYIK